MSQLLPTVQALDLQAGLIDYLTTTFALADADAQVALEDFLRHETEGIFKGPYVRLRLPFRPAEPGWDRHLEWTPEDFVPYGHQAAAFARLTSRHSTGTGDIGPASDAPGLRRPQPTLVTTGTGSGKTEAFLYPILDHVLRARRLRIGGTKALILYPMNALATDQASRLAGLITTDPRLSEVTAALFTGDAGPRRTQVGPDGLITDRAVIRDTAPDIVLTNYKMLDQLLLRHEDQPLWQQSADSLTYLVLDEFHTYDGAQGTDVAMLLRRLALALGQHRGTELAASAAAIGDLVPVATSATLGDQGDLQAMINFASTVFGVDFDAECVVTESRQSLAEWAGDAAARVAAQGILPTTIAGSGVARLNEAAQAGASDGPALTRIVTAHLYGRSEDDPAALSGATLVDRVRAHPQLQNLVAAAGRPRDLDGLAAAVLTPDHDPEQAPVLISNLVAALSHVRAIEGRSGVGVETHLWVRELTRIDRVASNLPGYRWSDDGALVPADALAGQDHRPAFPAIYCRHCGRSGWGVELAPTGNTLSADDSTIRAHHAAREGRFRALIHAPHEADVSAESEGLVWFYVRSREVTARTPAEHDDDLREGWVLPVLALLQAPETESQTDRCPACDQPDGIRFLGSSIATLLSVTLSSLFGSAQLDAREKKALVFTDSVQDAAHRAGFVESRSHTLTLRAAIRHGVDESPISLDLLVDEVIRRAGDDPFARYRLLAPDTLGRTQFDPFWRAATLSRVPNATRQAVRRRLLFDVLCEFGVHSRIGRTLEATGSLVAEVDAGSPVRLAAIGLGVSAETEHQAQLDAGPTDGQLIAWVRGTLEHLRTQGAIDHEWLIPYIADDGSRYRIWGGRARDQGMPAFPTGRTAPAFPRIGPRLDRTAEVLLDSVTSPQSWYARWSSRVLRVPAGHGARLARALLERLNRDGVLLARTTRTQATAYAIPASSVVVHAATAEALGRGDYRLRCSVCHTEQAGSATVVDQLDGSPCLLVRCAGTLRRTAVADNYYRRLYSSADMRRIVAREHSSLLDDETRLAYETAFRAGQTDPSAPNALVATPTLEMGIDIGDLSAVLLASLPRHVASYLQRIGRAGRLTGNSLNLAFVTGRGQHLPRLGDPLSLIDGQVRPPATYLSAEEILRRQYLAHLVDDFARDEDRHHPRHAPAAIGSTEPGSFLGEIIAYAEAEATRLLERFLGRFRGLLDAAVAELRDWATPSAGPRSSGLAVQLLDASYRWRTTVEALQHREAAIQTALPELIARAESPAATEDDRRAMRAAQSALRQTGGVLGSLRGSYWIGVLEEYGLLPNYTLLDDSVALDVSLSWLDPETQQYDSLATTHKRASAVALHEFAPGATFYARGLEIEIDAVDLGIDADRIQPWSFCADCGYCRPDDDTAKTPAICPRCASATITDARQRLDAVEMTRVSAQAHRDEARINDRSDERKRARFTVVTAADIDPDNIAQQWFVAGYDFGARYLRRLTIRWLNLGPRVGFGTARTIAGDSMPANLFRVCGGCGVLDRASRANRPDEHRAWCRYRTATQEHTETVVLTRTLVTQGVVIPLPWSVSLGDSFAVPSLTAAVLLGLREQFGGSPDHIGVTTTVDPVPGGDNREALLLHDLVPGGTGYLAELAAPEHVWRLLRAAWQLVATCPCAGEGRLACHRCLLPYAPRNHPDAVSRAAAERHLRAILTAGAPEAEPGAEMGWVCTTEAPVATTSLESHLEHHFRRFLIELVRELSGTITEVPGPLGNTIQFSFHDTGSGRTWLLEPQVNLPGARPDFLLSSTDLQVPRVAIFTDGYAYHASPAHNELADDARKRRDLRSAGYLVLSVTASDLQTPPPSPGWYAPAAAGLLVGQQPTIVSVLEQLSNGPAAFLRAWLTDPSPGRQRDLANVVPYLFAAGQRRLALDPDVPLAAAAVDLQEGRSIAPGPAAGFGWQRGALTVLVRIDAAANGQPRVEIAAVLDDRPAALAQPGYAEAWRDWLRLANSLQQHTVPVALTTRQLLPIEILATSPEAPEIPPVWRPVWEAMIDDSGRALVQALAAAGAALPAEVGEELGSAAIPVDLAWPDRGVVVLVHPEPADVSQLSTEGWIVVAAEADKVLAALNSGDVQR